MNWILPKKKVKDDMAGSRPSIDSEYSRPFRIFSKTSKTTQAEEPKLELDLSNALPSSDDFRTSLLMNGLSARFSMLREQDDPTTKVGKASDDSVLFPKMQSKISSFDHRDDASLKSSLLYDLDSLTSEDLAAAAGSIMNRGKPTDGNNLFGGRQKVFMISANGKNGGMSGRALYGDDVSASGFQKWRQAEKEKQMADGGAVEETDTLDTPETTQQQQQQPQQQPSSRRGTESTVASPPPVSSRNASVSSSPFLAQRQAFAKEHPRPAPAIQNASAAERSVTKTRRLYEQGLNQDLVEQQSSTFSRMNSLSKVRAFGAATPDSQTPINTTFGDRRQVLAKASIPNLRSFASNGSADSKSNGATNPPLSPPISESDGQSSLQRKMSDASSATAQRSIPSDLQSTSFFDDSDAGSVHNQAISPSPAPHLSVERPDDDDHPAFRKSGPPTPGSLPIASEDSPTLGPNGGLRSMVRAHLRSGSAASSLYENVREAGSDHQNNGSGREASPALPSSNSAKHTAPGSPTRVDEEADKERDEFARHLADGARRVREKLTSYVDADPDRATPLPSSPVEASPKELNPPRPTLGLLRSKSSRGSLFDRENREQQPRSLKTAMSTSNITVLPSPRRIHAPEAEEIRGRSSQTVEEPEDNIPVGLKAFRQARRELQKMKELELQQKYPTNAARPPLALRTMSYEPSAPVPSTSVYTRIPTRGESRNGMGSRSGSRAPSERDRSGSEASSGGRASRMRNGSVAQDDHLPESPSSNTRRMLPPLSNGGGNSRSKNGSRNGTPTMTSSGANFPAPIVAPPLPSLNPRRNKNGAPGEDDSPSSPRMPGGFPFGDEGSDEDYEAEPRRQGLRRATSEGTSLHGRARTSPPRGGAVPPLPQGGYHNGALPGGMI